MKNTLLIFIALGILSGADLTLADSKSTQSTPEQKEPKDFLSFRETSGKLGDKFTKGLFIKNNHTSQAIRATIIVSWRAGVNKGRKQHIVNLEPGVEKSVGPFGIVDNISGEVVGARFY